MFRFYLSLTRGDKFNRGFDYCDDEYDPAWDPFGHEIVMEVEEL